MAFSSAFLFHKLAKEPVFWVTLRVLLFFCHPVKEIHGVPSQAYESRTVEINGTPQCLIRAEKFWYDNTGWGGPVA